MISKHKLKSKGGGNSQKGNSLSLKAERKYYRLLTVTFRYKTFLVEDSINERGKIIYMLGLN